MENYADADNKDKISTLKTPKYAHGKHTQPNKKTWLLTIANSL